MLENQKHGGSHLHPVVQCETNIEPFLTLIWSSSCNEKISGKCLTLFVVSWSHSCAPLALGRVQTL